MFSWVKLRSYLCYFRYKWTTESPYHPSEQQKILKGDSIRWYIENYDQVKVVEPDDWLYKVGDHVEILHGKDKGKKGDVIQVYLCTLDHI